MNIIGCDKKSFFFLSLMTQEKPFDSGYLSKQEKYGGL